MALNTFVTDQDAVLARLRSSTIPAVYEEVIPPGAFPPKDGKNMKPYVLVGFGGRAPVAVNDQSLAQGSAADLKWTTVAVDCVAESARDVRQLTSIVRGLLEGWFVGPDWGEMSEILAGDYTVKKPDYDLTPVRHHSLIVFNSMVNAVQ